MYEIHVWFPQSLKEKDRSLIGNGFTDGCVSLCACWELNRRPLEEQSMLFLKKIILLSVWECNTMYLDRVHCFQLPLISIHLHSLPTQLSLPVLFPSLVVKNRLFNSWCLVYLALTIYLPPFPQCSLSLQYKGSIVVAFIALGIPSSFDLCSFITCVFL